MYIPTTVIPKRELLAYQADVKGSIFRQIRQIFNRAKDKEGFNQKLLASRIDMDEGQLSRRLRGDYDLKLETLSDLARGLECRIDVRLIPLFEVAAVEKDSREHLEQPLGLPPPKRQDAKPDPSELGLTGPKKSEESSSPRGNLSDQLRAA